MGSILWVMTCLLYGSVLLPTVSTGQQPPVTIDGSLQGLTGSGNNAGLRKLSGQDIAIDAEMGLTRGSNLFHSFGRFNVPDSGKVTFSGPSSIENILSRVTGNDPSNINGILASTIDDANLYLMNPNGIIFGKNASLNVKGSFYATTANSIEFEELIEGQAPGVFHANKNTGDILTTAAPEAFGFLGDSRPTIVANGTVEKTAAIRVEGLATNGSHVIIIARDAMTVDGNTRVQGVQVAGNVVTQGGDITLTSVDSSGRATINTSEENTPNELNLANFPTQGQVVLSKGALIDTSPEATSPTDNGGGVLIQGGQLIFEDNSKIVTSAGMGVLLSSEMPSPPFSTPPSQGKSGNVKIVSTQSISLNNATIDTTSIITPGGSGSVELNSQEILINNGSSIQTESTILGNAGNVDIIAGREVTFHDSQVAAGSRENESGSVHISSPTVELKRGTIDANVSGPGNAGDIELNVKKLTMEHFEITNSSEQGSGQAGTIRIQGYKGNNTLAETIQVTQNSRIKAFNNNPKAQNGGSVKIDTQELTLSGGASITTTSVGGGEAGTIRIDARESVSISGLSSSENPTPSQLQAESFGGIKGEKGSGLIEINTPKLSITDGGRITTINHGVGLGGKVLIRGPKGDGTVASEIIIAGHSHPDIRGGIFTESTNKGPGGDIALKANTIALGNKAFLSTKSSGNGNAGTILIEATDHFISQNSSIETEALKADGGNIDLRAQSLIYLTDSRVSTSVQGGEGKGGNIFIDPDAVVLQNTQLSANAFGGVGGNINIIAGILLTDTFSKIKASSEFGVDGTITIESPIQQLSEIIAPLTETLAKVTTLYAHRCIARSGGEFSSFSRGNYNTAHYKVGGFLPSPLLSLNSLSLTSGRKDSMKFSQKLLLPDSLYQINLTKNVRQDLRNCDMWYRANS